MWGEEEARTRETSQGGEAHSQEGWLFHHHAGAEQQLLLLAMVPGWQLTVQTYTLASETSQACLLENSYIWHQSYSGELLYFSA